MSRLVAVALAVLLSVALVLRVRTGLEHLESNRTVWTVQRQAETAQRAGRVPGALFVVGVRELRDAIRRHPTSIEARATLGDLYLFTGREESAVRAYDEALRLEQRAEVIFNRGLALWALDREPEALAAFERAVILDPGLRRSLPPRAARRLRGAG